MKMPWFFLFLQILQGSVLLWRAQEIVGPQSIYGLLYWTLTLAVFVSHGFLSEKDPGFVSSENNLATYNINRLALFGQEANAPADKKLAENQFDNPNIEEKQTLQSFCRMCNRRQLARTRHCHECEKCVLTYDHHCVFVNNCIGEKNRPLLYLYLFLLVLQSLSAVLIIEAELRVSINYGIFLIFSILMVQFTIVGTFFIFHNYLMMRGMTTWQFFAEGLTRNENGIKVSYGKGLLYNLKMYWLSAFTREPANWLPS